MMNILYADDRPVLAVDDTDPGSAVNKGHNCRNCGAPLNKYGDCEYCGTKKQMRSEIVMDATGIRISCG